MYRDFLVGELSLASSVDEHWLWGAADLGPPRTLGCLKCLWCVTWLSYVARKLGCIPTCPVSAHKPFLPTGRPWHPRPQRREGEGTPVTRLPPLTIGSLFDPVSSFSRGSPACPAAQLWGPSSLGLLQGPKETGGPLASGFLAFR